MTESMYGLLAAEKDAFTMFFYLIFSPNPLRDNVRVIIDDGTIRTTLRRKKFHDIVETLCGLNLANALDDAMSEMGGYFILDREAGSIKKLHNTIDIEKLTPNDVLKDAQAMTRQEAAGDLYTALTSDPRLKVNDAILTGPASNLNKRQSVPSYIRYDQKTKKPK